MSEFHFQKVAKPELLPQRISIFDYFYVLMLMLYASRANIYFESGSFKGNFIGVMLPVFLATIAAFKWKVIYTKQFYFIVLLFVIYFLAASIKYYIIQPTFLITYLFYIFITYTTVKALKFDFLRLYEYLMFWLAMFSLFMWLMQLAMGGDTLYNMFARISILQEISFVSGHGLSALFYSIQPFETTLINNFTIPRNCGYAWEPGSFAVYLCLALFINLFITSSRKDSKLRFWILFATLISTQSTTGYVIMMLIIVFYFINKDIKKILLVFPIVIAVMIFVFSLPFMKNKILELIGETSRLEQLLFDSFGRENPVTPQRFTSLRITMVDFLHNPVLGLAAHYEDQWTYKLGSNISPISGIGNLFAQFGLFGVFFFLYFSIRSSFFLSRQMKYKGTWLLFMTIVFISVSYSILFIPLVMCFWMFTLCEPEIAKEKVPGGILSKGENFSGELAV